MRTFKYFLLSALFLLLITPHSRAQKFQHAGEYMDYMGQQYRKISEDFWSYTSAVAHGSSARKVENRRQSLLQTSKEAQKKIAAMQPYEGDKSLKDSALAYLKLSYHILNDDYAKIVNMEEVSEQSYDAMEAYLLAQDIANEKLKQAGEQFSITEKEFAKNHHVNLVSGRDDALTQKIKEANKVNDYHRTVYLIFFKSYKQELYLMDAIGKKNINEIEQNKNTLARFSQEGISKLDTMKAFKGDKSLTASCRQLLEFYKKECNDKISMYTNFFLKTESFDKTKKAFDAKREGDRKQEDVDQYNKAVNEINQAANEFNAVNENLNQNRKQLIDQWNKATTAFLDKHTPKYK